MPPSQNGTVLQHRPATPLDHVRARPSEHAGEQHLHPHRQPEEAGGGHGCLRLAAPIPETLLFRHFRNRAETGLLEAIQAGDGLLAAPEWLLCLYVKLTERPFVKRIKNLGLFVAPPSSLLA